MRLVFEVDGLFDGERVIDNAAVIIDGPHIVWVGERRALPKTPEGERSETRQAPGSFVLPGMINCHAHLTLDGEVNFSAEVRQGDALATLKAFRNARAALRAGVTTVRDLGANGAMVIEVARAIEGGIVEGPRIVAAGRGVTTTGGHGAEVGRVADGPDEVRKAVREQIAAGAKVVKIFSTGGILGEGAPPEASQYTSDETRAAVDEAHNAGLRITTHAHGSGGMRVAAEAGVDSIEHATLIDDEGIRLLKEHGAWMVGDLYNDDFILGKAEELHIPKEYVDKERAIGQVQRQNWAKAVG